MRARARGRGRPAVRLILSESSAARYALERGFATSSAVLNGNVVVTSQRGRHNVFLLRNRVGTSFVFKQAADDGRKDLEREAILYELLWSSGLGTEISIPELFSYDRVNSILVLRFADNAVDVATHYRRIGRISVRTAAAIGLVLARLHEHSATHYFNSTRLTEPQCASPFGFLAMLSRIESLPTFSAAEVEIIKILQADPEFSSHLKQISSRWQSVTLIHADLRFKNFLSVALPGARNRRGVILIDWEHAGIGDAGWDVGSVLAAFLDWWIGSIPVSGDGKEFPNIQAARWPLASMNPAIRAFVRSYVKQRRLSSDDARDLIELSVRYACVRLIQSAFEQVQDSSALTSAAVLMLQLAKNGMRDPAALEQQLLGPSMMPS
jgi:Ser/Thr protein kinase RdoA (MazF antagonist)